MRPYVFCNFILLFLSLTTAEYSFYPRFHRLRSHSRRLHNVNEASSLRKQISEHRIRLTRLQQETRDLSHEKAFLEKALELKRGQKTMQDGQVKLSQAELEDKSKEISMYKREAPRTLRRYNELVKTQKEMQDTLNRLHRESEQLVNSKDTLMQKIHTLNMGDLVERHARGLPDAMAGALRKSAAALVPFFDYLAIAADTNNRLVDHVGKEIDRYTHVNITKSPFMSGVLFYCVVLIPGITILALMKRLINSSSRLTAAHFVILGNFYFLLVCILNVITVCVMRQDPVGMCFERHEQAFIVANLFLALYYIWHISILALQVIVSFEQRNIAQFVASCSVGIHYFLLTWRRVFTDAPPKMYMFNYLVYGTIFTLILHERLGRLTGRELSENPSFRFVHQIFKRTGEGSPIELNLDSLHTSANAIWARLAMSSRSPRRPARRHVTDSQKYRAKSGERQMVKRVELDSEEDEGDAPIHQRRQREREPGGFVNFFFRRRGNESDTPSTSDSDDSCLRDDSPSPKRVERPGSKRRTKGSPRWTERSIWKWS